MLRFPGRLPHLGGDREGVLSRHFVPLVGEVVDHLLDADRVDRRPLSILDEAAHVGVRGPVDVDGEGRQRRLAHELETVLADGGVRLGVGVGGGRYVPVVRGGLRGGGHRLGRRRHRGIAGARGKGEEAEKGRGQPGEGGGPVGSGGVRVHEIASGGRGF